MRLVGIDIGGTFTDLALYDSEDGRTQVHKVHSTPDDPGRALVTGVLELCERAGIEPRASTASCTGRPSRRTRSSSTTVRGPGMVTTAGHARRAAHRAPPAPASRTRSCSTSRGRPPVRRAPVAPDGAGAPRAADGRGHRAARRGRPCARPRASSARPGSRRSRCASCSPTSTRRTSCARRRSCARSCRTASCTSADITPQFREFERFTTAAMNAFVGPGTGAYLERLEARCAARRRRRAPRHALQRRRRERRRGRRAAGDAHAVRARRRRARREWAGGAGRARNRLMTFDMGGTSGGHRRSRPRRAERGVGARHPDRRLPAAVADVRHPDDRRGRRLDRLPRRRPAGSASARAAPAPTRGRRATASAATSRRSPTPISSSGASTPSASSAAGCRSTPTGRTRRSARSRSGWRGPAEAAEGVLALANANMARTIRSITVERGHDPRDFASSPSAARARCTRPSSPRARHPRGAHPAAPRHHVRRGPADERPALRPDAHGLRRRGRDRRRARWTRLRRPRRQLWSACARDGADPAAGRVERFLDCRYVGQGYELRIPVPEGPVTDAALAAFHAVHSDEYGHAFDDPSRSSTCASRSAGGARSSSASPSSRARVPAPTGPAPSRPGASTESSSSCPRRTSTARRSSPASRSPARPSCSSSTPPSSSHRDGRPRRRRRASCSSPTPEGPAHERHDGRRPDHDRRHRRRAHVDRGRHGLPPDPHVVLVDHPRVGGLRLRDLRPRGAASSASRPSRRRCSPGRCPATWPASTGASPSWATSGAPATSSSTTTRTTARRISPTSRIVIPIFLGDELVGFSGDDGAPPRPRRAHAREVRDRRCDRRMGRGPPAQRGQGRGGGPARPLGLADPADNTRLPQARRRRPRGAGGGRAARGRPLARARASASAWRRSAPRPSSSWT